MNYVRSISTYNVSVKDWVVQTKSDVIDLDEEFTSVTKVQDSTTDLTPKSIRDEKLKQANISNLVPYLPKNNK